MKIAIVDDEKASIKIMVDYLQQLKKTYIDLKWKTFDKAEDVLDFYKRYGNKFDILITDIEMERMNGVDLANAIRKRDRKVIIFYITSHTEYMPQCFWAEPLNFWNKPISFDIVKDDIKRAALRISYSERRVNFFENRISKTLLYNEIVYFETFGKKVIIHTLDGEHYTNKSLSEFQKEIDEDQFIRISQTFIINYDYVLKFGDTKLTLEGVVGDFSVGRTYADAWKKGIVKYKVERACRK